MAIDASIAYTEKTKRVNLKSNHRTSNMKDDMNASNFMQSRHLTNHQLVLLTKGLTHCLYELGAEMPGGVPLAMTNG